MTDNTITIIMTKSDIEFIVNLLLRVEKHPEIDRDQYRANRIADHLRTRERDEVPKSASTANKP